jgi:hypothetical protein
MDELIPPEVSNLSEFRFEIDPSKIVLSSSIDSLVLTVDDVLIPEQNGQPDTHNYFVNIKIEGKDRNQTPRGQVYQCHAKAFRTPGEAIAFRDKLAECLEKGKYLLEYQPTGEWKLLDLTNVPKS